MIPSTLFLKLPDNYSMEPISGLDMKAICKEKYNDDLQSMLGYYNLDFFANINTEYLYFLLFDEKHKIIGQRSFMIEEKTAYSLSISIAKPYRNKGYGKLLLDSHYAHLKDLGITTCEIKNYTSDGEKFLAKYSPQFEEKFNISIVNKDIGADLPPPIIKR